ncbi:XylR family transcriptional regulator [Singulisphaera sp. PoT]|uniref:XylR family transcriptional regulator n=1 Tax=Singulisphaera sp. PoT TaxID=3411797 RepID=UPI003BF4809E
MSAIARNEHASEVSWVLDKGAWGGLSRGNVFSTATPGRSKVRLKRERPPHVAFIMETSMAHGREILHGVAEYVRENGPWTVHLDQRSLEDPPPPWIKDWQGDGILARLSPALAEAVLKTGIPTVDLDDQAPSSGLPTVQCDHEAIGRLAAEHLLERGFSRFAFLGYPQFGWSKRRFEGFTARIREAGFDCEEYQEAQPVTWGHQLVSWESEIDAVARWIAAQPKPLGLMSCNDFRGIQALDACRRAGVSVPEEVAVIGVDNETLACELAYPALSSVIPDCRRIGYQAAEMLDRMMRGERPAGPRHDVAPIGVAVRASTDVMAIADPLVADAMRFIRERACEGIRVEDVLDQVSVSRSVLQRRFRKAVGQTVHDAIARVRLRRVKELLSETDLSLSAVADRAGFAHVEYLSAAFRKATGSTPGTYRREHRSCRA